MVAHQIAKILRFIYQRPIILIDTAKKYSKTLNIFLRLE